MISLHRLDQGGLTCEETKLLRALADDQKSMRPNSYANIDIAKIFTEIIAERAREAATEIRATLARMEVTGALDAEMDRDLDGAETRLRQVRYVIERALNFLRTARVV